MVPGVPSFMCEQYLERALVNGVGCLLRTVRGKPPKKTPFGQIVKCLIDKGLTVVQADKERCLVVLPQGMFDEKANKAIQNFKPSHDIPRKQKAGFVRLLKSISLEQLRKALTKAKKSYLQVFFTGNTHKPGCQLTGIISERGTWQKDVTLYLQRILRKLALKDHFLVRS
ncbi:hypothetical protein HPB48_023297 [Haemaphysalis longicornis]|uniref:Tick transposon n=1 Tax=Haemaphysalis longicornis TaxID=44386 RepID=A0A9J6H7R1_HAELO|nr:hypothetical protein HPB48_023297 [Haemaphysalis longicornis]